MINEQYVRTSESLCIEGSSIMWRNFQVAPKRTSGWTLSVNGRRASTLSPSQNISPINAPYKCTALLHNSRNSAFLLHASTKGILSFLLKIPPMAPFQTAAGTRQRPLASGLRAAHYRVERPNLPLDMARIIAAIRQALFRHRLRDELLPSRAQEHTSLLMHMDLSIVAPGHATPPVPTITNEEMTQFFDFDAYERDHQAAMGVMEEVVSAPGLSMPLVEPMPAAPIIDEQDISYASSPAQDPSVLHSVNNDQLVNNDQSDDDNHPANMNDNHSASDNHSANQVIISANQSLGAHQSTPAFPMEPSSQQQLSTSDSVSISESEPAAVINNPPLSDVGGHSVVPEHAQNSVTVGPPLTAEALAIIDAASPPTLHMLGAQTFSESSIASNAADVPPAAPIVPGPPIVVSHIAANICRHEGCAALV